jgi:hypothetical protein
MTEKAALNTDEWTLLHSLVPLGSATEGRSSRIWAAQLATT